MRQLLIQYLIQTCAISRNRIAVEKQFKLYGQTRRFDLMLLNDDFKPWLIAECKEPETVLSQRVFDQVFKYNLHFEVPYCLVTNGQHAYLLHLDAKKQDSGTEYDFIQDFPMSPG
ncbi:MAG TPA: type I restriction enzyme HsdR N-terminal domain-containing protein [bacterium]|nr:type I restriction enzyme HsdR N-terminal domain-containing protein [bacterium]